MKQKRGLPLDTVMAAVIVVMILTMAVDGFVRQKMPLDAAKYPIFVFAVILVTGIWEIVHSLKAAEAEGYKPPKVFENRRNFLIISGMMVGYLVAMWLVGFIISTIVFAILFAWLFKFEKLVIFSIAAVIVTIVLYYCIVKLLYIFLPTGILIDMIL